MTKSEYHRKKAKTFLEDSIEKSKKSYKSLMVDLEEQVEKWKDQYRHLSYSNIFDLTDEEYDRKNYLDALILQSEILLSKNKSKISGNNKEKIIITGNNISIMKY